MTNPPTESEPAPDVTDVLEDQRVANEQLVLAATRAHALRDQAVSEKVVAEAATRSAEAGRDRADETARDSESRLQAQATRHLADMVELQNANRLATLGKLAASIAHELGTPLAVIRVRAQMIATGEVPTGELGGEAAVILEQTARMARMVREMLELARPKADIKAPVDLVALGQQAVSMLAPIARKVRVELELASDGAPTLVLGDTSRLLQIITNLVFNAKQSMTHAGVIHLCVGRRRACPPEGVEADYVAFDVTDEGSGIAPEHLARVFDTFFTTKPEGTGLGLAVALRIAKEHGGFIGVESVVGKGSRFTLYLPPLPA